MGWQYLVILLKLISKWFQSQSVSVSQEEYTVAESGNLPVDSCGK